MIGIDWIDDENDEISFASLPGVEDERFDDDESFSTDFSSSSSSSSSSKG